MKKLLVALAILLTPIAAHAQSSKATIISNINGDFADNTSGAITAALLRAVTTEIVSSYVDWLSCTASGGMIYYVVGTPTCLLAGTQGQYLRGGTVPSWQTLTTGLTAGTGIGISGTITPTISVSDYVLNGFQSLSGTGILARTAAGTPSTFAARTITGTASQITFTNGDGVAGNPTAVLAGISTLLDQLGSTRGSVIYRGASGWAILTPGTSGFVFTSAGAGADPAYTAVAGTGTVTSLQCGQGLNCTPNPITGSGTITPTFATAAQYQAATISVVLEPGNVWSAAAPITVTYAATITPDFSSGIDFSTQLSGNLILGNPTNAKAGQKGCYFLTQGITGSHLITSYGTSWKFAGGVTPVLSTSPGYTDAICFDAKTSTFIFGSASIGLR